jgi:hypothetical protein
MLSGTQVERSHVDDEGQADAVVWSPSETTEGVTPAASRLPKTTRRRRLLTTRGTPPDVDRGSGTNTKALTPKAQLRLSSGPPRKQIEIGEPKDVCHGRTACQAIVYEVCALIWSAAANPTCLVRSAVTMSANCSPVGRVHPSDHGAERVRFFTID